MKTIFAALIALWSAAAFAQGNTVEGFSYNPLKSLFDISTRGGSARSIADVEEGTFTATFVLTGGFSQSVTVTYRRTGHVVTLTIPNFAGTATATSASISTLTSPNPTQLRPTVEQRFLCMVRDGGNLNTPGFVIIYTGGNIEVFKTVDTSSSFTNGNSVGFGNGAAQSFTYTR